MWVSGQVCVGWLAGGRVGRLACMHVILCHGTILTYYCYNIWHMCLCNCMFLCLNFHSNWYDITSLCRGLSMIAQRCLFRKPRHLLSCLWRLLLPCCMKYLGSTSERSRCVLSKLYLMKQGCLHYGGTVQLYVLFIIPCMLTNSSLCEMTCVYRRLAPIQIPSGLHFLRYGCNPDL